MTIIDALNTEAELRWASRLRVDYALTRPMVSFQANKEKPFYRWFKYKEAFSASLVELMLVRYGIREGVVLDPFAGSGAALFAAGGLGIKAVGVELLPICRAVIAARRLIDWELQPSDVDRLVHWRDTLPWKACGHGKAVNELRITQGAYPAETRDDMGRYIETSESESPRVTQVLLFALLCILESISYTIKDGQYLRWDYRCGRRRGKKIFDKGRILSFDRAVTAKLNEMVEDLRIVNRPIGLYGGVRAKAEIELHGGSCLDILPRLGAESFDCVITSPPYCNRYDYTRTYALELALLGVNEEGLAQLRQDMLSCTVENRAKDLLTMNPHWRTALDAADRHVLLQSVLAYLDTQKEQRLLNNNGIPRMVRGYFYEMACVIYESARVLRNHGRMIMVNDNVRYAGVSVAVDIILSELAESLGFEVERIFTLPNGKGNSSQQMGAHGRDPLRKCVYVWRRNYSHAH